MCVCERERDQKEGKRDRENEKQLTEELSNSHGKLVIGYNAIGS